MTSTDVSFLSQVIGSKTSYDAQAKHKVKNFSFFHRLFRITLNGQIVSGQKSPAGRPTKLSVSTLQRMGATALTKILDKSY